MKLFHTLAASFWMAAAASAADPVISEFMADNSNFLADQDGQFTDWIEVYNPGPAAVNLQDWALTDDVLVPVKWKFPSQSLAAGQSVVVFASAKDRAVSGSQLHTNFRLNNGGEYLALVKPDGVTRTSEWNPFPAQKENVSWGTAQQILTTSHVDVEGSAYVPAGGAAPAAAWNTAGYTPDASWITTSAPPGIGYDTGSAAPTAYNIAPLGTAAQSTTNGANTASLATNGSLTDFTHTASGDASPFWNVDFGGAATIQKITLNNRTSCCGSRLRDITIEVLDGAGAVIWTSALLNPENTGFTYPAGPPTLEVDIVALNGAAVTGRQVRVRRTADADLSGTAGQGGVDEGTILSLGEVTVLGLPPSGQLINLARTGSPLPTVTMSSQLSTYAGSLAVNGLNTDFTHTNATGPYEADGTSSLTINLNRSTAIHTVNLHNREACCPERLRDIRVIILGTDGTTVLHTSALLNPNNVLGGPADLIYNVTTVNGGNPIIGQYVKIARVPDATGGASADDARVLSLGELQVRGTELNGYRPYYRNDIQTVMKDITPTAYLRLPFTVTDPAQLSGLSLRVRYDDGFVAYINGQQVAARNAPASPDQNSTATADRAFADGISAETIDLSAAIQYLVAGSGNVLAIHGMNTAATDADFLLEPSLFSTRVESTTGVYLTSATPAALNDSTWYYDEVKDTVFSHRRGFYDVAFNLSMSTLTPETSIYYTTNNSDPSPTNGTLYTAPVPVSTTTVVRARAFRTNWKSTNIDTHTYIFLNTVTSAPKGALTTAGAASGVIPAGWPTNAATNGGQAFNFGFTASVMAGYTAAQIREGLTQIPSLSLVSQQDNLTSPTTGIYVNGTNGHGEVWERPASVEMLDITRPGATLEAGHGEFGENCGLRLRGGASRGDGYPKHSFRVFFRDAYGKGKLNYRLFGPDGAGEYDTFDLRGSQNYSWSNGSTSTEETLVRDPFCRELLGAMGQQWTRSRFVHVYLNGLYWGIYEIHERPENSFGETYLGGNKDNYDVVKNKDRYSGVAFSTEATDGYLATNPDGSTAAWKQLWDLCKIVKANPTNANYYRILGCNADGTRNPAYPVLLDVDNLIDYTLALFYSGDGDACLSGFLGPFNQPNNWHGMRDRLGERGFTFFNHDAEHTLRASSWAGSRSVATTDQTGPWGGSNQTNFTFSNPQWMHEELMASPEYRLRYADHIRRHCYNGGALTPAATIARWNARTATITKAIVPYAGRWATAASVITTWKNLCGVPGDSVNGAGVIDNIPLDFLAMRTNPADLTNPQNLLRMLNVDGLYPALAAPDYSQHGGSVPGGYSLTMTGPAGAQIYYTLDGSDPRAITTTPTPLTYLSSSAATRYYVNTAASGGDNGFTATALPPPAPGPVSRYPLDGAATDSVGTNNGTLNNAPVYTTDRFGTANSAILLNGTNQSINLGNPANLQIVGQITMAAWVRPTVLKAGQQNILNKGHNTTPNGENTLRITNGALEFKAWNGADHGVSVASSATLNTWQHVCGVYDGTTWRLYKNGVEIGSAVDPVGAVAVAGSAAANNAWNIGSRGGAPTERAFTGSIDDVVIFNRGLTPLEVMALYDPAAVDFAADWKAPAYSVPAAWGTAAGGIGYDTDSAVAYGPWISTDVQSTMQGTSTSLLTRREFSLSAAQIADTGYLVLKTRYDDGFIAYLNGVKVAERNTPAGQPRGTSAASAARVDAEAIEPELINITAFKNSLVDGTNVLAIQGLNTTAGDNDFLLQSEIVAADNATVAAAPLTPGAMLYTGPITLTSSVTVKARVFQNGVWSALNDAFFSVSTEPASAANTVVSEVLYSPLSPSAPAELAVATDKDEYEFIEIRNIGTTGVDLTSVRFTGGITTNPLGNQILAPGERAVFVKNTAAFGIRYGAYVPAPRILGTYTGSLSDQGEQIVLNAANGSVIRDFTYDNILPWPVLADGAGQSMVLIAPSSNPDHALPTSWRASASGGGTPGTSGYTLWKNSASQTSDTADTDHDGLDTVLEYALRTFPGTPDNQLPLADTSVDGYLQFTLRHRNADDLQLTPQVSTELMAWTGSGITMVSTMDQGDGTSITVWKAPATIAAGQRLFFKVLAAVD